MSFDTSGFRVDAGETVHLGRRATRVAPLYGDKEECARLLREQTERISGLQEVFYAAGRYALLLIFQAMDAGGKDGVIKHVLSGVNPQGCQVTSFKGPSVTERQHDFLWRAVRALPERGRIGVFNRSYYEDVLIVRVHPAMLAGQEGAPGKRFWEERFRSIRALERHLHENGTRVVKFYLHLSKEEQAKRFLARIDDPDKNWKLEAADLEERTYWGAYMDAYEACLGASSTEEAPWFIVPADDKPNARLIVSRVVLETLAGLKLDYPKASGAHRQALLAMRHRLERES